LTAIFARTAGIAGAGLDFHQAIVDFRHLIIEQFE
jgi:hypothetical protein